ncbi:hypothetical protein STAFG_8661 [Streptomyces afghaniensis 772]|uniref:Uncharacterized protein n=1 Tax=Streptomyces afghaniensis 772 TaxID=1283301 RepID=S4M555_9ACTN|nr:hypothetical protein STAFG_8661 [Streptomyces afghaniensis 772]
MSLLGHCGDSPSGARVCRRAPCGAAGSLKFLAHRAGEGNGDHSCGLSST